MFEAFLLYVITCIWANIEWYFRMGYGKIRQKLKKVFEDKITLKYFRHTMSG